MLFIGVCKDARTEFNLLLTATSIQSYRYRVHKKHRLQYACITGNLSWFTTLFGITKGSHDILNVRTRTNETLYHLVCTLPNTDGWANFFRIPRNSAEPINANNTPKLPERVQILTILFSRNKLDVNIRTTSSDKIAFEILTDGVRSGDQDELLRWWLDHLDCFNDENRNRCLPWLAYANRYDALRNFCRIPTVDLNITTKKGFTALLIAAVKGYVDIVDELLKYYPQRLQSLNQRNNSGETALYISCEKNHVAIVRRLCRMTDVYLNLAADNGSTPLMMAASNGYLEIVDLLLAYYPQRLQNLNQQNSNGFTALHMTCDNNHLEVVRRLCQVPDVDLDIPTTDDGSTPLMAATSNGHTDVVEELLLHYPQRLQNLNYQANGGETALYIACEKNHLEVVRRLCQVPDVDLDIPTTDDGSTVLMAAASKGHTYVVEELLLHYPQRLQNLNQGNKRGATALYIACEKNHLEVVRHLCQVPDVDIDIPMKNDWTPLMVATSNGHTDVVEELLLHYPHRLTNLNQQNSNGATALYIACEKNRLEIVRRLCRISAVDLSIKYKDGHTPTDIATEKGHTAIVSILTETQNTRLLTKW